MTQPPENSKSERSDRHTHLKYENKKTGKYLPVELINFSRDGMCFESGYEVSSGARIKIKKRAAPDGDARHQAERGCIAEVKWCKPVAVKDAFFFRVGVEYIEPANPNVCLNWRAGDKVCISPPLNIES